MDFSRCRKTSTEGASQPLRSCLTPLLLELSTRPGKALLRFRRKPNGEKKGSREKVLFENRRRSPGPIRSGRRDSLLRPSPPQWQKWGSRGALRGHIHKNRLWPNPPEGWVEKGP